ncbi:3-deoxy-7-phosphoheptulonate synthase class II [Sedimentisphaera salicampi]|uniref:3-deoxy-7-phosphoheptulonate synthase class II n=1 Tax=Sedimentisphaera salicampi TaxID=1941349 RepID=UPI000B9B887E|nr:3-deoxy-7-phosphoheptulonate synthase class II [Sedimentisphaera salicampi]OXU15578.1 Phospho-2-dehydro-3-deoxyheptonate aldolase [Sedimentisphaera salicampi]
MNNDWNKNSWKFYPIKQQPLWPNQNLLNDVFNKISKLPALVFAGETRSLETEIADAASGKTFILQAGDCSEEFSRCNGVEIHDLLKVILQMSIILSYAGERKVVKIGRIAGQYAKPRSSSFENINGISIPSYRGDMVNCFEPSAEARRPDPNRIIEGYFRSAATLNLVRAFTSGGYASLENVHGWSEASCHCYGSNIKYEDLVKGIKKTLAFMDSIGIGKKIPQLNQTSFYTSHEALLLDYEEALTRIDTTTGKWYDTSAHMLWVGDRTRQPEGAHVEFLRGVHNPIGVKVGPAFEIDELKSVLAKLNPTNKKGRISLITRLGACKIKDILPELVREISREGINVTWICDPMHGNTFKGSSGKKTRRYEDIIREIREFWEILKSEGSVPAGLHLELTGNAVTECIGGNSKICFSDLELNYRSTCDPRLNAEQAVELAFELAEIINE